MRKKTTVLAFGVICFLLSVHLNSWAGQGGDITAGSYFGLGLAQQQIHIDRFLRANRRIMKECAPRMTSQSFQEYFNNWLAGNPGFLSRSAQLAFTASIFDRCENRSDES